MAQIEWKTLKRVNWPNTKRRHSAIGYVTPPEVEEAFRADQNNLDKVAQVLTETLSSKPGAVQMVPSQHKAILKSGWRKVYFALHKGARAPRRAAEFLGRDCRPFCT